MKTLLTIFLLLYVGVAGAQNVGIGTTTPNASAQLEISSTSKGLLIPRMTSSERAAISNPAQGLLIYQTDGTSGFYVNRSGVPSTPNWSLVTEGINQWLPGLIAGNIYSVNSGNVGIGTTTPLTKLNVRTGGYGFIHSDATDNVQVGTYVTGTAGWFGTRSNHPLYLFTNDGGAQVTVLQSGNVGIGITTPNAKLDVNGQIKMSGGTPGVGKLLESDASGLASWVDKSSSFLPVGATGNTLRHNGTNWTSNSLLYNNGTNIGIGTTSPDYKLDVQGRMRLGHNAITSGLWLDKSDNTEGAFIGMVNDSTAGFFGNATSGSWKVGIDVKNGLMGIGTTDPSAPLSFPSTTGNKISLWGDASGAHYGLGIQGSLLQLYSSLNTSDIAFGYGSSTSFTEAMRIKGNGNVGIGTNNPGFKMTVNTAINNFGFVQTGGAVSIGTYTDATGGWMGTISNHPLHFYTNNNVQQMTLSQAGNLGIGTTSPAFSLDVNGRVRLRDNGGLSPGIWFNKPDNSQGSFIGQYDATNFGIWGPGASGSWKFLFDGNDGTLRIGTTDKATGYLLNVGGKIISEEVRVQLQGSWPDYVFEQDYKKLSIPQLESYLKENKHLPNMPSAKEIEDNGQHLGEVQRKMMEKIEELTLYIIEQNKKIEQLEKKVTAAVKQ